MIKKVQTPKPKPKVEKPKEETIDIGKMIADGFKDVKIELGDINKRLDDNDKEMAFLKTGKDIRFKSEAMDKDIEAAKSGREGVDKRIVSIVNELLGEDFGIELDPREDGLGMRFTIIVPRRLSMVATSQRPIVDKAGVYKKDANDKVVYEEYQPEDRRSRPVATSDNFSAIRKHCNLVLSNIVATYTKLNKPLPEFRTTQYDI